MNKKRTWTIAIVISVAAGIATLQNISTPSSMGNSAATTITSPAEIPSLTATYEGCGYMWAYHDDVELSARINDSVQAINSAASARAQLFGEDCVFADGHSTFGAMETDFYIEMPVNDLTDEEVLGNRIRQGMDLIVAFPQTEIAGRKGFVEFSFRRNETEQLIVRIMVDDYGNDTSGSTAVALFRRFYTPSPTPIIPLPVTPTSTQ